MTHLYQNDKGLTTLMTIATISIVSHGHGPLLGQVLRDLSLQTVRDRLNVVVTLNLADEPFDASGYDGLRIQVLRNPIPRGFGANHNAAFSRCDDEWFLIVNPDVRLPDVSAIEKLLATSGDAGGKPGMIAPRIMNSAGGREDSVRPNLSLGSLLGRVVGGRREALATTSTRAGRPFFWVAGMFVVASSDAFRAVGGFDERFFLYCEDYDLCARLYLSGRCIVVREDVVVIHDAQRDSRRSRRYLKWHMESLMKVWTSKAFWGVVFSRRMSG
jgi:N-acetylglucosaminyl-diphospho-decaprenol L-rhamnosyltransferase